MLAGINDVDGLGTRDFARVPKVWRIEFIRSGGDDDLIGGLFFPTLGRFNPPRKARMRFVEAERGGEVFAAERDGG
jgi:hypothetical protein